jgi:uncharacterized membrane protein
VGRRRAERQIVIEGSQQECFNAVIDFESFPDWQRSVSEVEVLTRHRDGRVKQVTLGLEVPPSAERYTLDYSYEEPHHVSWQCLDVGRADVAGELVLENRSDGTTLATCSAQVGALDDEVIDVALEDLKARVEVPTG